MLTVINYVHGWAGIQGVTFGRFFLNSFAVAILSVAGNIVACSLAAFAFARLEFRFRKIWFSLMLMTLMLPFQVTLIPQYVLFHLFGWINSYLPLVVPWWLARDSFFILLMVQFMRGVPLELDDSATIDGCGHFQIYARIIMPLAVPAIITTAIFTFYLDLGRLFQPDDLHQQRQALHGSHRAALPDRHVQHFRLGRSHGDVGTFPGPGRRYVPHIPALPRGRDRDHGDQVCARGAACAARPARPGLRGPVMADGPRGERSSPSSC